MPSEGSILYRIQVRYSYAVFLLVTDGFLFQAKAMAGDHVVRSLLEKMTQSASSAYLGILERYLAWIIPLNSAYIRSQKLSRCSSYFKI